MEQQSDKSQPKTQSVKLKDYFNSTLISTLANRVQTVHPSFNSKAFENDANTGLEELEMRPRSRHISEAFFTHLNRDYVLFIDVATNYFKQYPAEEPIVFERGILVELFANIIEIHGTHELDNNLPLFQEITQRFTAEFVIRPFIEKYPDTLLPILTDWSAHKNHHIRRLCSEGTRPLLPWGKKLHHILEHPELVIPILHNLIHDESKYVQKSVANHLNDISKNQPEVFYTFIDTYKKDKSPSVQWILKHALRNEIKKGNPKALAVVGVNSEVTAVEASLSSSAESVLIGNDIHLETTLENKHFKKQDLILDYKVHFVKANGSTNEKVFKWSRQIMDANQAITLTKKHSFKLISTRVYHPGNHKVELLVNGNVLAQTEFELK